MAGPAINPPGEPRICRGCELVGTCDRDPADCAEDAREREAESRWEAATDR